MKTRIILIASTFSLTSLLQAAPIDLSSWTELTLDYAGGQPAGNWDLESGNTAVVQTVNADPSFYLNNLNQTSYSIDGTWQVLTGSDDDYMGFVFGYQNSSNFYLFDWKQGTQSYVGRNASEGMTIKKFTGGTGDGLVDLSLAEFWENQVSFGDMTILAQNHGGTEGWADNQLYKFHLDFNTTPGEIHVKVQNADTDAVLWDVTTTDTTFSSGEFGFYNFSQQQVRYAGFEQTGGVIVPDSGQTLALFGLCLGLMGIGRQSRRARN